jgi:cytochrome c5
VSPYLGVTIDQLIAKKYGRDRYRYEICPPDFEAAACGPGSVRSMTRLAEPRPKGTVTLAAAAVLLVVAPGYAQIGRRVTRPKVERPDGPVWEVIRKHCTACHGIDDYAFYAQDRAAWQKLIADKHKSGEADLSEADRNLLLDWLVSKFGPDTKPFPRTYVPPEINTFFTDPEAFRLLNRACTKCHGLEQVQTARKAAEAWRVMLVDMRERGAQLSDVELEQLVEWLARVWGTNQDK